MAPTYEAIAVGEYKVSRPLFIYAKKQHVGVVPGMDEFVAEYVSDKAMGEDGYLAAKGLVALPADEAKTGRGGCEGHEDARSGADQLTRMSPRRVTAATGVTTMQRAVPGRSRGCTGTAPSPAKRPQETGGGHVTG